MARRRERGDQVEEALDLVPIMNLVTILIPFLLMAAQFVHLAVIDSTLPAIGQPTEVEEEPPDKPPLVLTVALTDRGFTVTGADAVSGQLRVVPGSHRALMWPAPCVQPGLDLEPLDLPTRTGDVTVHLSCTLHMSQPPVERTRKVLYTGFRQQPVDLEAAERNRQRLNDVRSKTHTSVSQPPGYLGD